MINELYNLSLRLPDLVILLGCALFFGVAGVVLSHLSYVVWWSRAGVRGDQAKDAGDGVHTSILALIGFLLALITTNELSSFSNADHQVTVEGMEIRRLDRDLQQLGSDSAQAQQILKDYVNSVVTDEWKRLAQRPQSLSPESERHLTALWGEVRRIQSKFHSSNANLTGDISRYVLQIEDARRNRLSASVNSIPDVVWLMIGMFFVSACVLYGRSKLSNYSSQVAFIHMSALGLILALDIIIDNPFGGDTSISPVWIADAIAR